MIFIQQLNHKQYRKLLEINRLLTQCLDLKSVLKNLVEAAHELIESADTVILYYYKEDGYLHFVEGVGVRKEMMNHVRFSPGESLTGHVFLTKESVISEGDLVKSYMEKMTQENWIFFHKGVYEREIISTICVPLLYKGDSIGVLVIDNFEDKSQSFSKEDAELIEIIADQASVAIMNTKLFEDVQLKNGELLYSLETQRKFTKILLEGKGPEQVIKGISRILRRNVYFVETVQIKSNTTFPIIISNETFGYFVIDPGLTALTNVENAAIEQATTAMALEIVKQNALYEKELHLREDLFCEIIEGVPLSILYQKTKELGIDPHSTISCMIIEGKESPLWNSEMILEKERTVRHIEDVARVYCAGSVVFTKAYQLIILLPQSNGELMRKMGTKILVHPFLSKNIVIGVGRPVLDKDLVESYQEARESVNYAKKMDGLTYVTYSELGVERLWYNLDRLSLERFIEDKLGAVSILGRDYLMTLETYVNLDGNHKQTANVLHIHPNTLAYRLKKIEDCLNISFTKKRDWLNLMLAMDFAQYTNYFLVNRREGLT